MPAAERKVRLAHSPDADDAFMFCGLATGAVSAEGLEIEHVLEDIETLNQKAREGIFEVTAISIHAYAYVAERYALMTCGASMGDGYGPLVVAREPMGRDALSEATIATPGAWTSAWLALKLCLGPVETVQVPFDRIGPAVASGEVDAGILIHEGQLSYAADGLVACLDLGAWWKETTGLPLPLGGNAVRRDVGDDLMRRLAGLVRESVAWGLSHRSEALAHALGYARGLDEADADRFVGMYVNDYTLDYGPDGRKAVELFLAEGAQAGLLPEAGPIDFVEA
ncbi:MAG: MqnA/MqnD/SBP family protein [bacterium]|nr:MqnA/MqnD/SBP family protein [bacterium]